MSKVEPNEVGCRIDVDGPDVAEATRMPVFNSLREKVIGVVVESYGMIE